MGVWGRGASAASRYSLNFTRLCLRCSAGDENTVTQCNLETKLLRIGENNPAKRLMEHLTWKGINWGVGGRGGGNINNV